MKGTRTIISVLFLIAGISAYAQNITVKGSVTDAQSGESVPATSVMVKGI